MSNNSKHEVPTQENSYHMRAENCDEAVVIGMNTYCITGNTPPASSGMCCTPISEPTIIWKNDK